MPPNSAQFLTALGKPAQRPIFLYRMVSSLMLIIRQAEFRIGAFLEAVPWRR
jgi:hypothetical protein